MQSSDEVRRRAPFPLFLGPPVGFSSNCSFFCTPFYFLAAIRKLHRKKLKCGLLSRLELSVQETFLIRRALFSVFNQIKNVPLAARHGPVQHPASGPGKL